MNTEEIATKYGKSPEMVAYWLQEFGCEYLIETLEQRNSIVITAKPDAKRLKTDIVNAISEKTGPLASLSKMTIADLLILETKLA